MREANVERDEFWVAAYEHKRKRVSQVVIAHGTKKRKELLALTRDKEIRRHDSRPGEWKVKPLMTTKGRKRAKRGREKEERTHR